jgi:hypothetical protein
VKIRLIQTIYASNLKSRAVLVMNYLVYRANNAGTCFPAIKTIAKECHIGVNTVKRALDDLVDAGYVQKEARFIEAKNGAQTSNLYTLSEGLFETQEVTPEVDVAPEAVENCELEDDSIAQETFESMAQHPHEAVKPIGLSATAMPRHKRTLSLTRTVAEDEANSLFFSCGKSKWAGVQPIKIPP